MRRKSRPVNCGGIIIGGIAPISIQSMTNTDTRDAQATIRQIKKLEEAGCQIVRCAVPDLQAAEALASIKKGIQIPLVADIHFDYRLAIAAMESGVDKIRINPGNIGGEERVAAVVKVAKERQIPIRIGVNSGSIEKRLLEKHNGANAAALAESAMDQIKVVEKLGFYDLVISLKASSVPMNYDAHMMIADQMEYPLHIGITESGSQKGGYIKSAIGIGSLLLAGIGDTLRVSFTGDPCHEIPAAKEILRATEVAPTGINLVSCPTCGRCGVDLAQIVDQIEPQLKKLEAERMRQGKKPITVAIMGCAVNGPGEARAADIGIACGKGEALLFRAGAILGKVAEEQVVRTLLDTIRNEP